MKRLISILLCAVMIGAVSVSLIGCHAVPRDQLLKIYMPGDYFDESVLDDFSAWYEQETGNKIVVSIEPFDAVEDVQQAVEASKADYDLLCPSDYMVEYLISKNLLKPVDKTIIDVQEEGLFKREYIDTTKEFDKELKYAVPYMYGTLGLVYDYSKTNEHITSWSSFFGDKYAGKRSIKKSIHDDYAAACLYNARESLLALSGAEKKAAVQKVFEDTRAETVKNAQTALESVTKSAVWDVDNIKFEMASNSCDVNVALMWSCDAGYVMNDYEDDEGNELKGNRNLWYVVPEEGGNVYIDAFVISAYAKNETAANYFLKYICQTEIAVKNSKYSGCISPVAKSYDELYDYYYNDEDGMFEDTEEGWKEMFIETMFPSEEVLNRCGVMKDFGAAKEEIGKMFAKIIAG